jgi:hypothetical protein
MSDLDFTTDLTDGFSVSTGENSQEVSGNRLLLNIFEITFLTKKKQFVYGDEEVVDPYGGDAERLVNKQNVLNDTQSMSAALIIAINETVKNMQDDESKETPATEKISKAELVGITIIEDSVYAIIQVFPVEAEPFVDLSWRLPIIKRG